MPRLPDAEARAEAPRAVVAAAANVGPARTIAPAPDVASPTAGSAAAVKVELQRQNETLQLVFPFSMPTSGAVFPPRRCLWVVVDSPLAVDIAALRQDRTHTIAEPPSSAAPDIQVIRLKLQRPRLTRSARRRTNWIVAIGDAVLDPTQPLTIGRNVASTSRPAAVAPFEQPQALYRLPDPEVGDTLLVVTGFAPARGLLREQDFVEFRMLASVHGIVVQPMADDVDVELSGRQGPGFAARRSRAVARQRGRPARLPPGRP